MPDLPSLVIVGAGGFGREVAALVEAINDQSPTWSLTGFVDDDPTLHDSSVMGYPVHGDVRWLANQTELYFVIGIGDGQSRRAIAERLAPTDVSPTLLTHPSVSTHRTTTVERGTVFCDGAAPTVNVTIGRHAVLDQHCTVGHNAMLEPFVSLRPGAHVSGSVHLEPAVTIGAGAVVLQNVRIGARSTVGAGAVVVDDLPPDCTAVGAPARPLS